MLSSLPINFSMFHWSKKMSVPPKKKLFHRKYKSKKEILMNKKLQIIAKKFASSIKKLWMFIVSTTAK